MAAYIRQAPPRWLTIVAVLLLLWGAAGLLAFYSDVTMSETAAARLSDYDRALLASRPGWFLWVYGAAVWAQFFGGLALLLRRRLARPLFAVALLSVVIQFGYIFAATDIVAVKGAANVVPFPVLIAAVTATGLWLSIRGSRRGWLR